MKVFNIHKMTCSLLGASLLLGGVACSDDHFDVKPGLPSASNTIWQNIEQNPDELDSLAMILRRVKVYRKETDSKSGQTYADLLNQPQTFTFFAPVNGTYHAKAILDQLDKADELKAEAEKMADADAKKKALAEAFQLEYTVGKQFVQNHLARFNYESSSAEQELRMLNAKVCRYNKVEGVFNGVALVENGMMPSSNGTLHLISGQSPFQYNIFDFLAAHSDIFSKVYNTISDPAVDKNEFSEALSVPGSLNENGDMVYVDSVYINTNSLLNYSGAQIKNEDSLYVAVVPTDVAWDAAVEKVGAYYNYQHKYKWGYNKTSQDLFTGKAAYLPVQIMTAGANNVSLDDVKHYQDSITNHKLITSMYFTPSIFNESVNRNDSASVINYALNADSLISTNGYVFYNPEPGQVNPMFDGKKPYKASNGYIFPVDNYNIDPSYSFQSKLEFDVYYSDNVGYTNSIQTIGGSTVNLTRGVNWDDEGVTGEVEYDRYRYFAARGAMRIFLPLRNVLSGSYKVSVVMLPSRINFNNKVYTEDEEGKQIEVMHDVKFDAYIVDDERKVLSGATNKGVEVDNEAVKTYVLFDKVTFPKSYNNLPTGVDSCPFLYLSMPNSYQKNDAITYALCISKIILEPVHE